MSVGAISSSVYELYITNSKYDQKIYSIELTVWTFIASISNKRCQGPVVRKVVPDSAIYIHWIGIFSTAAERHKNNMSMTPRNETCKR